MLLWGDLYEERMDKSRSDFPFERFYAEPNRFMVYALDIASYTHTHINLCVCIYIDRFGYGTKQNYMVWKMH